MKIAVASLLGTIFLKNLIDKTLRGMEAVVKSGRFAGGKAYGYRRHISLDVDGEVVRGHLEIHEKEAAIVARIFRDFAAGQSSIQIATALNADGIPGPRGGDWNASTIRGDPKKATGILNNPLYVGRLVWGRRQWRRNPDSEMRERRYRLRDQSEWIDIPVPQLRIIDNASWDAVQAEIKQRQRTTDTRSPAVNRAKSIFCPASSAAPAAAPVTPSVERIIIAVRARRSAGLAGTRSRFGKARWNMRHWRSYSINFSPRSMPASSSRLLTRRSGASPRHKPSAIRT